MQQLVTAQDLADTLNRLRLADPMWTEGGFRVSGRWLEIDPDLSDALAAQALRCDIDEARRRNEEEARWLVAGGVGVVYVDGKGWQPAMEWKPPAPTVEIIGPAPEPGEAIDSDPEAVEPDPEAVEPGPEATEPQAETTFELSAEVVQPASI
jgi:hypothetical protein